VSADNPRSVTEFVSKAHIPGSLTLVIVNTVDRSRLLREGLRYLYSLGGKPKWWGKPPAPRPDPTTPLPDIKLIHSRFRPFEREGWMEWLTDDPSKFPEGGRIIVSTQVVEAGVDLSARTLITELAPWPSLVQRIGRCNRRGEFSQKKGNHAQVFWIDVPTKKDAGGKENAKQKSLAPPYADAELNAARRYLGTLSDAGLRSLQQFFDSLSEPQREDLFPYSPAHVIRQKDFLELYDTTPDLAGSDIDVSRFIRDGEELDVQVFWRVAEPQAGWSKAELRRQAPRREELCPVPFVAFRDGFLGNGKVAYRFDSLGRDKPGKRKGEWVRASADRVFPGQVYWIPAGQGGYDPDLGWSLEGRTTVLEVPPPALRELPDKAETGYDADEWSEGVWQTVAEHTEDVVVELTAVAGNIPLENDLLNVLQVAARWHDWGKAHATFQKAIRRPDEYAGRLLAKAPDDRWDDYERPHFRHELASALGVLAMLSRTDLIPPDWKKLVSEPGLDDLAVYLIAAHHGKVRLSIRSLPGEKRPTVAGTLFARGVWDGDPLPQVDLGGKGAERVTAPAVTLELSLMQLGTASDGRPSWAERMIAVRDRVGPLAVAYLEAILRAADMRASRAAEARSKEASHA
jgi:CRISPR-associated endonuclease/helicase Cas3